MEFSTCPSCGLPTMETIEMDTFEADDCLAAEPQSITMFECMNCHWIGSTSTVNLV